MNRFMNRDGLRLLAVVAICTASTLSTLAAEAQTNQKERATMATSEKIDLYKKHKEEYIKPKKPTLVDIREAHYLSITGQGAPGGDAFVQKVGALYGVAFTVKMRNKSAGQDYVVAKLEGLWWGSKPLGLTALRPKSLIAESCPQQQAQQLQT